MTVLLGNDFSFYKLWNEKAYHPYNDNFLIAGIDSLPIWSVILQHQLEHFKSEDKMYLSCSHLHGMSKVLDIQKLNVDEYMEFSQLDVLFYCTQFYEDMTSSLWEILEQAFKDKMIYLLDAYPNLHIVPIPLVRFVYSEYNCLMYQWLKATYPSRVVNIDFLISTKPGYQELTRQEYLSLLNVL